MDIESRSDESQALLSSDGQQNSETVPTDPEPLWGFAFLGFCANLPFNYLFQEAKLLSGLFGLEFGSRAPFIFSGSTLAGQILMLSFGRHVSYGVKIVLSLVFLAVILIFIPLVTYLGYEFKVKLVYGFVSLLGLMTAVINSSCLTLTSLCSSNVRKYFTLGSCLAGITGFVTIWVVTQVLSRIFGMSHERQNEAIPSSAEIINCVTVLASGSLCLLVAIVYYVYSLSKSKVVLDAIQLESESQGEDSGNVRNEAKREEALSPFWQTIFASLPIGIAAWNIMFVTFLVLPEQVLKWEPSLNYAAESPTFYHDIALFSFSCFDVIGRIAAIYGPNVTQVQLFIGSLCRWFIVPCFYLAASGFVVFGNDFVKLAIQTLFGVSYGFFITHAYALAPYQTGVRPENAGIVGAFMSFIVVVGICMGSGFSSIGEVLYQKLLNLNLPDQTCGRNQLQLVACRETLLNTS
jgi:hypothetical protein